MYERLAKEYPSQWEVETGWAQWCWHQRKLDDAGKHYARAVTLGAKDEAMFLAYARVLGYTNHTADAVEALSKGAELHPESDEIHLELGALLVRNGNFGAALAQLRMVHKVQPGEAYRYFYNQAFAEYRLGEAAPAKEHVAKARTYTRNPAELSSLERLERSLESPKPVRAAVPVVEDGGAPRMVRREASEPASVAAPAKAALPAMEGSLEMMECGKLARLHVRVEGKVSIFVIPDPTAVTIRSGTGESVELQCGAQRPARAVRIEFSRIAGQGDVAGLVRTLELK
jgi:tetratricopeptide (TPR) repeat protein